MKSLHLLQRKPSKEMSDRTYNMILKLSWLFAGFIIFLTSVCFKPAASGHSPMGSVNYTALASGNWTVSTTWAPGSVPPLIDNNNGDNFAIGSSSSTCNVVTSGGVSFGGNSQSLYIYKGSSLTINGDVSISNSITITIEQGATLVINGSLTFTNGATYAAINGELDITGNLTASSNSSGTYGGTGYVQVGGTVSDPNGKFTTWRIDQNMRYAIASSNWTSDTGTWSNAPGGVIVTSPSTTSNVHIETYTTTNTSYTVTMDGSSETVASLIVGANNTLTIQAGKSLNVTGSVTINGTLNILSDATGTGVLYTPSTITGTGTINIQRYCAGTQFHYISSPFSNTSTTPYVSVFNGTYEQFYYYNESSYPANGQWEYGWTQVPTASTFTVARGYALYYYPTTWLFSGTTSQLNQGTQTYPLQHTGAAQPNSSQSSMSWNLVGNPYYSTLDAKAFINGNSTQISGTLYFWDVGSEVYTYSDYATYNLTGGTKAGAGGSTPSGNIEVGQGFMVSSNSATNLNFTSSMQSTTTSPHFFKSLSATGDRIDRLSIDLSDASGNSNNILIGMSDSATTSYTPRYDGLKRKGNDKIAFYSIKNQQECAISCYPPSTTEFDVPLSFDTQVGGDMKISIFSLQNNTYSGIYYLVDSVLHKQMRCYPGVNYTINVPTGTTANRMYIKYIPPTLSVTPTTLSVAGDAGSSATFSVSSNTNWHIDAPSWIHLSNTLGGENQTISITADENLSVYPRQDVLNVIVNGMAPQVITVNQDKGKPFLSASQSLFKTSAGANSDTILLTANIPWNITGIPSWISVNKTSGNGSDSIFLTAAENLSITSRSANLIFNENESLSANVSIQQAGATSYLNLNTQGLSVSSETESVLNAASFSISSNTSWQISAPSWVSVSTLTGSGDQTVNITAQGNPNVTERQASISVTGSGMDASLINLTQSGGIAFFNVSPINFNTIASSNTETVVITSNVPWNLTGAPNWLTLDKTAGNGTDQVILTASENQTINPRTANLVFTASENLSASVNFAQAGAAPFLSLSTESISVGADAQTLNFVFSTNTSLNISFDQSWASFGRTVDGTNETLNFNISQNTTANARTAHVGFSATGVDAKTLSITQSGFTPVEEITVYNKIRIYPNPSSGTVTLNLNNTYNGIVWIKVKDLAGREIKIIKLMKDVTDWSQDIHLESLANGFYILNVQSNQSSSFNLIIEK